MKYKIVWPDPEYLLVLICVMDVGKYKSMRQIHTKMAFCHEQGLGLFQFTRLPFGLTGAPSSFQQLMDNIFVIFPLLLLTWITFSFIRQALSYMESICKKIFVIYGRLVLHNEDTNVALVNIK